MTITSEDRGLVSRVGPFEIDWPKSVGYFGVIGLALVMDLIALPIALFIAAIPVLKLFKRPGQPWAVRVVADALEGAAKPVGGDSEAIVRHLTRGRATDERPAAPANGRPRVKGTPTVRRPSGNPPAAAPAPRRSRSGSASSHRT